MPIPRIYEAQACPLPGYDGFSVRLLVNPTYRQLDDWRLGTLGTPDCPECAAARETTPGAYCPDCTAARERKGRGAAALFGPTLLDRPCSTPDEALAVIDDDDLPAELVTWLLRLPVAVVNARLEELRPNSTGSSTTLTT